MNNNSANILDIKNIEVTYDDVILALHDVSLKVPKGKVVALLGANGAGKSTTLKAVSTMLASERGKVTKGSIDYDGNSIEKQNPSQMVGLGMVQVLEGRRCFGHLTVEENIISGAYSRKLSKGDIDQELEKIYGYFLRLKERRKSQAAFTSGGEQQMIAVARAMMAKPKMLLLNFPSNPTAHCVDFEFFQEVVSIARDAGIYVVHDLAYADITFDGYKAPSIMQIEGAKDHCVEFFSLSKSYNMPGWRVGFMVGNDKLVSALGRLKSYLDYGMFTPIQVAAIAALEGPQECVTEIRDMYQMRRDVLCEGMNAAGWEVEKPKATMFVWAKITPSLIKLGSLEFSKMLLASAKVAVSPGIGFGQFGDDYVRFALIENVHRTRQAIRGIKEMMRGVA